MKTIEVFKNVALLLLLVGTISLVSCGKGETALTESEQDALHGQKLESRSTCSCYYLDTAVPGYAYLNAYVPSWVGKKYPDVNFSGTVTTADKIIIEDYVIALFDDNNDDALSATETAEMKTTDPVTTYDFNRDGTIDYDDNWAAFAFTNYLSDIAPPVNKLDSNDIACLTSLIQTVICQ